ncbi:aminoglycoside N(3)-acetyltransferase [Candidatus Parcubacteria bacterium]|nr:MAG: aminoglycoside N(3)-acetyltransferase [Candidatus Parcubacteria bacterium]
MKGIIEKEYLVENLRKMGAVKGAHLMVHSSLSALGFVEGGANTVVQALIEAVGDKGSVIMPSFKSAIRSDKYGYKDCKTCEGKKFCTSSEEGTTGAIPEVLRLYPGALRSCHPTSSWVGFGAQSEKLLEGHRNSPTQCGKDSPFFRLMELDGLILLIGVGVNGFTNMHSIEDVLNVPYLGYYDRGKRHAPYTISGRRIQYQYPLLMEAAFEEAGIIKKFKLGSGQVIVMKAREIGSFLWISVNNNVWSLVLRPRGNRYEPFEDACIKVSEMVNAWKNQKDCCTWQEFFKESKKDIDPNEFYPAEKPRKDCPAYAGVIEGYHRCMANDPPPWEQFIGYPPQNYGLCTCDKCSWPEGG